MGSLWDKTYIGCICMAQNTEKKSSLCAAVKHKGREMLSKH